VRPVKRVKQ